MVPVQPGNRAYQSRRMSKFLAILLFPLCAVAQVGVEMPILYKLASASTPDFVTNQGIARFYWNWKDLTNGITVSNQWLDRVQSVHLWQMNTTLSPTNSSANGVRFNAAQQLTNLTFAYGVGATATGTVFIVFSFENPAAFPPISTTADGGSVFGTLIDNSSRLGYNGGNGERAESSALPNSATLDVIMTFNNGSVSFYTNGALSKTDASAGTAAVDSFGSDGPGGDRYQGWFFVYAAYSNVMSATGISNLHYWRTNVALSGIGGSP